jgi:hypothetical protein
MASPVLQPTQLDSIGITAGAVNGFGFCFRLGQKNLKMVFG